ncbi:MAG: AraC family transcriptional regulator, partial [Myxococcaceae bacterium]|nr:AraC family transcriptional regulator [Myxococcaceae bacterium]
MLDSPVEAVLEELLALCRRFSPSTGEQPPTTFHNLASATVFSIRTRAYAGNVVFPRPVMVAVLEGRKDIIHGRVHHVMVAGDVFVAPRDVPLEVISGPNTRTGRYSALILEPDAEVVASLVRRHASLTPNPFASTQLLAVRSDPVSLQALLDVARTLLLPEVPREVLHHRLEDLLLSLLLRQVRSGDGAPAIRQQATQDLVLATRQLIRSAPEEAWPARVVARRLAVSPATLRRRLSESGVSLRTLRNEERMLLAAALLAKPGTQVTEVALRCGYRSPSKFARQFRLWFFSSTAQSSLGVRARTARPRTSPRAAHVFPSSAG